jgi:hypothetical protein
MKTGFKKAIVGTEFEMTIVTTIIGFRGEDYHVFTT